MKTINPEKCTKTRHIRILKASGKENILKVIRDKTHFVQRNNDKHGSILLVRNHGNWKAVE
jgi:hypothetical protein